MPLEKQFYIGFYNKAGFAKAGITSCPTDWNQLYAACTKLKAAGYTPFIYGNGGQALSADFYPWYDLSYLMIGSYSRRPVDGSLQRLDPLDLVCQRRRSSPSGPSSRSWATRTPTSSPRPTTSTTSRRARPR